MSESTCKTCGEPIVWGLERGGKWVRLEPRRDGSLALLKERYIVETRWSSFDSLPARQIAAIPANMVEPWRAALDGERFRPHDKTCAYVQATRIKPGAVL